MLKMLQAHGLDAGPTQRPFLAGALGGLIAVFPALVVLMGFGSLTAPARTTGTSAVAIGIAYGSLMLIGGGLYGWLFQRAANDRRGGWLFGMAFGFVLWMLGPIPLLQWLPPQPILRGYAAVGLFLGELLWGLALGVAFPYIHRQVHVGVDNQLRLGRRCTGPEAAAQTRTLWSLPSSRSHLDGWIRDLVRNKA